MLHHPDAACGDGYVRVRCASVPVLVCMRHARRGKLHIAQVTSFLSLDIAIFDLFTGLFGYGKKGLEAAREHAQHPHRDHDHDHSPEHVCVPGMVVVMSGALLAERATD